MIKRNLKLIIAFLIAISLSIIITVRITTKEAIEEEIITPEREYIEEKRKEAIKKLEDAKISDSTDINNVNDALDILRSD